MDSPDCKKILIVGGGVGGLATALCLHQAGFDAEIFEQAPELRELGVGFNVLPHAISVLAQLDLLPALDRAGIRTRELFYCNRFGQTVWQELRGSDAGYDVPQFSIHRGKLQTVCLVSVILTYCRGQCFNNAECRPPGAVRGAGGDHVGQN